MAKKDEETPDKIFDKVSDNFKKICTKNGIDTEAVQEFIINIIKLVPEEDRANFSSDLIFNVAVWGSRTPFEAIGIVEATKLQYNKVLNDVWAEEDEDDD